MVCDEDPCGVDGGRIRGSRPPLTGLLLTELLKGWVGLHQVSHGSCCWGKVVELEREVQGLDIDWSVQRVMMPLDGNTKQQGLSCSEEMFRRNH